MSAFQDAADQIWIDDNLSRDAIYRVGGVGSPITVRVVFSKPMVQTPFGETGALQRELRARVRYSEVAAPKRADTFTIDGVIYRIETVQPDSLNVTAECGLKVT